MHNNDNPTPEHAAYEIVGADELARRWDMRKSWVYEHTRQRCDDPIPTVLGSKPLKFAWGSSRLEAWWQRQAARGRPKRKAVHKVSKQRSEGEFNRKEIA